MCTQTWQGISTHAPAQGATDIVDRMGMYRYTYISTHAPAQGATGPGRPAGPPNQDFNPRSRTGSDSRRRMKAAKVNGFQPTLPHRERLSRRNTVVPLFSISTHAPAQGATGQSMDIGPNSIGISTHAPAQGATETASLDDFDSQNFNPRSRTGSDDHAVCYPSAVLISTHAPAQGATKYFAGIYTIISFQPTLPHRERPTSYPSALTAAKFQPTLPHRERPKFWGVPQRRRHFNPRSRTGSDEFCPRLQF